MSLLCIGDLHIDKLSYLIPGFTKLVLKCLVSTIQDSLRHGITDVVLAGDIFDSPFPTQSTQVAFFRALSKLDVNVMALLGNHDYSNVNTHSMLIAEWLGGRKGSNFQVISKPTSLKIDGVKYLMMPHPYVSDLDKSVDFGIGHFAVNGARADNGFTVRSSHAPKGNWILGDFHTPQSGRSKSCKYDYLGSLTQLGWKEKSKKSVIRIEDGEKLRVPVSPTYRMKEIIAESDDDVANLDASVFYNIRLKGGYALPTGWLIEHPNVVKSSSLIRKKDKRADILLEDSEVMQSPLVKLPLYLQSKNIPPKIAKRAVEIAETLRAS